MSCTKPLPDPPGGLLTCSSDQVAVVRVTGGKVYATCHEIPDNKRPSDYTSPTPQFRNFVLEFVLNEQRDPFQRLTDEEERIWTDRRYEGIDPTLGQETVVTFAIPGDGKEPTGSDDPTKTGSGWDAVQPAEHTTETVLG